MRFKKFLLGILILFVTVGMSFYRYDSETGQWIEITGVNEYGSVEAIGEGIGGYCNKSFWDAGVSVRAKIEILEFRFIKIAEAVTPNIEKLPDGTFKVPNHQYAEWRITIQVASDNPIDNVIVTDNFGGEFGVESPPIYISTGTAEITYQGASQKAFLTWTLGNNFSGIATLILKVYTDINPGGQQEFTSAKRHTLNSGAVLKYGVGNTNYMIKAPSIEVVSYEI